MDTNKIEYYREEIEKARPFKEDMWELMISFINEIPNLTTIEAVEISKLF